MTSIIAKVLKPFMVAVAIVCLNGCGPKVNKVDLQFEDDFSGLLIVRAKSNASVPFSGKVVVPKHGELDVSEKNFYGDFRINATRQNGARLKVELLSKEASGDAYAVWWLPDGAYIRYFFLGRRDEMERFYQLNKERLYKIEETRLMRSGNNVELKK